MDGRSAVLRRALRRFGAQRRRSRAKNCRHSSALACYCFSLSSMGTTACRVRLAEVGVAALIWFLQSPLLADFATMVRREPSNLALKSLNEVLTKFNATLMCQFDAFADYVIEAEEKGIERYPVYHWARATIEDPTKKANHRQRYTVYVSGEEVYSKEVADALEADLTSLADGVRLKADSEIRHERSERLSSKRPGVDRPPAGFCTLCHLARCAGEEDAMTIVMQA